MAAIEQISAMKGIIADYEQAIIAMEKEREKDAEIKVIQDFEEVEQEAREAGFL